MATASHDRFGRIGRDHQVQLRHCGLDPGQRFASNWYFSGVAMTIRMPSLAAAQGQAAGDVVGVADPGQRAPVEPADQLADGVEVGQRLAGMAEIGQAVDHRAVAVLRQFDGRLVAIGADDDDIGIFAQHAAEIGDALAAAEARVVAQEERAAAEMDHAGLEAHAGPQRGLFEEQRHHAARQQRLAQAAGELGLQVLGDGEDALDFGRRQIGQRSAGVASCRLP